MNDFHEAVSQYRTALAHHLAMLRTGKLDNAYRKSGRAARRALKRARLLAAAQQIEWDCGNARTFY